MSDEINYDRMQGLSYEGRLYVVEYYRKTSEDWATARLSGDHAAAHLGGVREGYVLCPPVCFHSFLAYLERVKVKTAIWRVRACEAGVLFGEANFRWGGELLTPLSEWEEC